MGLCSYDVLAYEFNLNYQAKNLTHKKEKFDTSNYGYNETKNKFIKFKKYPKSSTSEGDIETLFSVDSSDTDGVEGKDKFIEFEEKQPKLSFTKFTHLGFHAQPTMTPKTKAIQIGARNIINPVYTPTIVGLSNILCKASTRAITPNQHKPRKQILLRNQPKKKKQNTKGNTTQFEPKQRYK